MTKAPVDIARSVRARLLNLARERGEDYQLLLTRYVNERLLYRLEKSGHGAQFVLKGAVLFTLWTGKPHRTTRDVDLLGFGDATAGHLQRVFAEILSAAVLDDGVMFDVSSLSVAPIREENPYGGMRVTFVANMAGAKISLQVDVGFGDAVTPAPVDVSFPTLLNFAAPRLRAYPRETVVAEKLQAVVAHGMATVV